MKEKILKILAIVLLVVMVGGTLATVTISATSLSTTISEDYIPSETTAPIEEEEVIILETIEVERVEPSTYDEAVAALEVATTRETTCQTIYDGLISLGYAENHPAVVMAKTDLSNAIANRIYYTEKRDALEETHQWEIRNEEFPAATEVWLYMKNEFGWSDTVCAGILGNMMAECGGCWSSDLNWSVNSSNGYGMIQWIGSRRSLLLSIYGPNPSIEDQLNYMRDELYGTNGVRKQVSAEQLDKIMNAETPEECAMAFATYYERCAPEHRSVRKGYARRAYEYFVG